jgi:hypothetical protein
MAEFDVFTALTMKNAVFYDLPRVVLTRATRRKIPEDGILQSG